MIINTIKKVKNLSTNGPLLVSLNCPKQFLYLSPFCKIQYNIKNILIGMISYKHVQPLKSTSCNLRNSIDNDEKNRKNTHKTGKTKNNIESYFCTNTPPILERTVSTPYPNNIQYQNSALEVLPL